MSNLLHIATVKTDPLIYVLSSQHFFGGQTSFIGNFPTQYVIYQSAFRIENLTPNFFFYFSLELSQNWKIGRSASPFPSVCSLDKKDSTHTDRIFFNEIPNLSIEQAFVTVLFV